VGPRFNDLELKNARRFSLSRRQFSPLIARASNYHAQIRVGSRQRHLPPLIVNLQNCRRDDLIPEQTGARGAKRPFLTRRSLKLPTLAIIHGYIPRLWGSSHLVITLDAKIF
jgi:hypothetical protein